MTAPLPPHWMPINLVGLNTDLWKPAIDRYAEAYAKLAVREALERATDAMHHAGVNTWEDAVVILRAMLKEYE